MAFNVDDYRYLEPYAKEIGGAIVILMISIYYVFLQFTSDRKVLDAVEWRPFKLIAKDRLSHNTNLYKFGLPRPNDSLGLPIGQHISVMAEINGKQVVRSYTPTTLDDDKGHFDLVVKTYDNGNISKFLSLLTIGQDVKIKGPKGKFVYTSNLSPHLLMIAGGTGITPMYQIIKSSLKDPKDKTKLCLIYANVEEDDILLRKELEELRDRSGGRFELYHVLNKAPQAWTGGVGFVTRDMIESHMPKSGRGDNEKVLMCGPPPMMSAMKNHLKEIGYPAPRTVSKLEDQIFLF